MHLMVVLGHKPHYIYSASHHHFNEGKCQAPRGKDKLCTPDHGHRPSVPSRVLRPGFLAPPGAGAVGRGPVPTASTSVPAVYFRSDCKHPHCTEFSVFSSLQTRVKGQLGGTTAVQRNVLFLPFSIAQEPDPVLGWEELYSGGKLLPPVRPLPAALKKVLCPQSTTDEATVSP